MKQLRTIAVAAVCVGLVSISGCSKTEDTSPESRVFGSPPVIEDVQVTSTTTRTAICDVTDHFSVRQGFACRDELPAIRNPMPPPDFLFGDGIIDDFPLFDDGGIRLVSTYSEIRIEVVVSDPDSVAGAGSDVLLVGASYLTGTPPSQEEETIVLFDDGSSNVFVFEQKTPGTGADCTVPDPGGSLSECSCTFAKYEIDSRDAVAGDGRFSRSFAFGTSEGLPMNGSGPFNDCIAIGNRLAAATVGGSAGSGRELRIEAIDRSGNLTEWPAREPIEIGTSNLTCEGDPCACCLILPPPDPSLPEADGGCRGKSGLRFVPNNTPGSFGERCPDGLCQSAERLSLF